ncbi:MAG: hypothetical protein ACRERU_15195, partial [Methylococcales bacterium]
SEEVESGEIDPGDHNQNGPCGSTLTRVCNLDRMLLTIRRKSNLPDSVKKERLADIHHTEIWGLIDNIATNFDPTKGEFYSYVYTIVLNLFRKGQRTTDFLKNDFIEPPFVVDKLFWPNENKNIFEFFRYRIPDNEQQEIKDLRDMIPDQTYLLLTEAEKSKKYDLHLMSTATANDLVAKGRNLVVVALIGGLSCISVSSTSMER